MIGITTYFVRFLKIITGKHTHTHYCGAVVGEQTHGKASCSSVCLVSQMWFEISGQCPCWFKCSPLVGRVGLDQTIRITFSHPPLKLSGQKKLPFLFFVVFKEEFSCNVLQRKVTQVQHCEYILLHALSRCFI